MTDYWMINAEGIVEELGVSLTDEQMKQLAKAIKYAHDEYGEQHGHREADKSLTQMLRDEDRSKIFNFVEEQIHGLDHGPNFYDRMNDTQRGCLARLLHIKKEFHPTFKRTH